MFDDLEERFFRELNIIINKQFIDNDKIDLLTADKLLSSIKKILDKEKFYLVGKLFFCCLSFLIFFSIIGYKIYTHQLTWSNMADWKNIGTVLSGCFPTLLAVTEGVEATHYKQRLLNALRAYYTSTGKGLAIPADYYDLIAELIKQQTFFK